jgi:GDP-4-dehydro-6-deoxy-D-mannose reductase
VKRALVTGADGFVGPHLLNLLIDSGYQVHGLVRTASLSPHALRFLARPAVNWITDVDIRDATAVQAALAATLPDLVFHLAGIASPAAAAEAPRLAFETNVCGTAHLLGGIASLRGEHGGWDPAVLIAGSASSYGSAARDGAPVSEDRPLEPLDTYGVSKAAQEMVAREHAIRHRLRVVVTRSFNHTGPGQLPSYVVPDWIDQLMRIRSGHDSAVLRVGNIDVERDFLDVRDVVRAYLHLAGRVDGFQLLNVCSGRPVALRKLLELIQDALGTKADVRVEPRRVRADDVARLVGDASRLHAAGWRPEIGLDRTIRDMVRAMEADPAAMVAE